MTTSRGVVATHFGEIGLEGHRALPGGHPPDPAAETPNSMVSSAYAWNIPSPFLAIRAFNPIGKSLDAKLYLQRCVRSTEGREGDSEGFKFFLSTRQAA